MFSRGENDVHDDRLESASNAKSSSKRKCCLKIFYISGILFIVAYFIFIHNFQSDIKKPTNPKPTGPKKAKASALQNHHDLPSPMACGIPVKNDIVVKVDGAKAYLIGSYVEHNFGGNEIKTIAIMLRNEQWTYSCVLCCEGKNVTSPAKYSIHYDHFGFDYGTADIICPINSACSTPTHVAITANELSQSITSFRPIRNRDIPKSLSYNFTVCISVMYDYKNVLNLVQAMEMFKLLGVQRVAIYKTNCDSDTQKVLDYYVKSNFMEIIPWRVTDYINVSKGWKSSESAGELHYYGQIPALNDCVYRYMYQSQYVALQDIDELILPLKVKTWTELLPELEKSYGTDVGFEFENNVFSFQAKVQTEYERKGWKNIQGANILQYVDRIPNDPSSFNNFKILVNPRLVSQVTVHGLLKTVNPNKFTIRVDHNIARLYHFKDFPCPANMELIRDKRHLDYAEDLMTAVSRVLLDCGFIKNEVPGGLGSSASPGVTSLYPGHAE
ncbi:uncharacterized protein si:zfos-464b6.2 isoform X3 [Xyrauchen texanus]|uniref:uncharacterized protein si:zfos-464b6.2 isoform X1 n=1 Tax=Xyrauchen texanus TaxID=154827 RepID=UPI002242645D|nr:uncharacterized protein si:zfos-464b6.2 isoform X1 [Xyrauchen texanus]XP_051953021.1 uncharacterized protein si:zfos-464b6.2 isoform X2 [Xyrauchen texanus]XP_051953022.1 uncharacterized protein si:zfos-464b6.2 isoform X3 [Xyrauchen texanus]